MTDTFRALCVELVELSAPVDSIPQLAERLQKLNALADRARALLAQPVAEGPMDADLHRMAFSYSQPCFDFEYIPFARDVLSRWGRPAAAPVPGASNTYFEFVIFDADYCTQAEGIAPTYAQALSEGQHYLAQYQQDDPHTLELRRVEVLNPHALPTPEATND